MKMHDESSVEELLNVLKELSSTYIEIGILGSGKKYKDGNITVLGVATIHEFGINVIDKDGNRINIPERSFIRSSYDTNKQKIFNLESELSKVMEFKISVESFFNLVGEFAVGVIQRHLTEEVKSPPLASSTIAMKGSSNPLIDTGQLKDSIDYRIVRM